MGCSLVVKHLPSMCKVLQYQELEKNKMKWKIMYVSRWREKHGLLLNLASCNGSTHSLLLSHLSGASYFITFIFSLPYLSYFAYMSHNKYIPESNFSIVSPCLFSLRVLTYSNIYTLTSTHTHTDIQAHIK